jgi:hypothetical protein
MKHPSILVCAAALAIAFGGAVSAQGIPPGGSIYNPPLPPPPPPPKIEPPVIPKMDAPARPNYAPAPRPSFSDRISTCLDQAAAAGFGPGDREAYSRSCANR